MQLINSLTGAIQHSDSTDKLQYTGQDYGIRKNTSKYGLYIGSISTYNDGTGYNCPVVFCKSIEKLSTADTAFFTGESSSTQVNRAFLVLEYDNAGELVSVLFEFRGMDGISNKRPMIRGKGSSTNPIEKTVDYEFERMATDGSFPVNKAFAIFTVNNQPNELSWSLLNKNVSIANKETTGNTYLTLSVVDNWSFISSGALSKMEFMNFRLNYRPLSLVGISTEEVETIAREIAETATSDIFNQAKQLMDKYMVSR